MRALGEWEVGFSLLDPQSARDVDCVRVVESDDVLLFHIVNEGGMDVKVKSTECMRRSLAFDLPDRICTTCMYNWQFDDDVRTRHGSPFYVEWHLLEHVPELMAFMKRIIRERRMNCNPRITVNGGVSKYLYNMAANLFFARNGRMELDDGQLGLIRKIHDYRMGWDEFGEKIVKPIIDWPI